MREAIYQRRQNVCDDISKHLEESWAAPRVDNTKRSGVFFDWLIG